MLRQSKTATLANPSSQEYLWNAPVNSSAEGAAGDPIQVCAVVCSFPLRTFVEALPYHRGGSAPGPQGVGVQGRLGSL
jgi:hypothetical protein